MQKIFFGFSIYLLLSIGCHTSTQISEITSTSIEFNTNQTPNQDTSISNLIAPYKDKLESEMNAVIGSCDQTLTKARPEGLLGNLIADLTFWKTKELSSNNGIELPEICLLNHGGLRTSLPKGSIYKKRIFELMPFENELVVVTLSGEKTKLMFDFLAYINGMPIAGATMGIKDGKAIDVKINEQPIDTTRQYRVATSDYLAFGGDNMTFFLNPLKFEKLNYKLRDGIIDYIAKENKAGRSINAKLDKRIYVDEK